MAQMMPTFPGSNTSSGELDVFKRLKNANGIDEWMVLHSLDVAHHRRQVVGEIDFVIVIPSLGVLCIEVKGCSRLERTDGAWFYGNDAKPDYRGPFKQASEAMHSIRSRLVKACPELSNVVFWSGVIFPYVDFPAKSEEWHPWQVIDRSTYRARPLETLLTGLINHARTHLNRTATARWFIPASGEPTLQQCATIKKRLRPDFEYFESPQARVGRVYEEVKRYTEEQYAAIDAMESNPRVLYVGPAGTGKSLLAIEAVRRSAVTNKRTLFICYNELLSRWLKAETRDLDGVETSTLHALMMKYAGQPTVGKDSSFWCEVLPELACKKIIEMSHDPEFDHVVIDEAQDICDDRYLDFLDLIVNGGIRGGNWRIFGDFNNQAIFHRSREQPEACLRSRAEFSNFLLKVNCRNRPRLAEYVRIFGGLGLDYSKVLRPDDHVDPTPKFYANREEHLDHLIESLQDAYESGFQGDAVVVLSPKGDSECLAASVDQSPWQERLQPTRSAKAGHIRYSTIQGFKGLEAPFVIVTDLDRVRGEWAKALLYIALSRALERVVIISSNDARDDMLKLILP